MPIPLPAAGNIYWTRHMGLFLPGWNTVLTAKSFEKIFQVFGRLFSSLINIPFISISSPTTHILPSSGWQKPGASELEEAGRKERAVLTSHSWCVHHQALPRALNTLFHQTRGQAPHICSTSWKNFLHFHCSDLDIFKVPSWICFLVNQKNIHSCEQWWQYLPQCCVYSGLFSLGCLGFISIYKLRKKKKIHSEQAFNTTVHSSFPIYIFLEFCDQKIVLPASPGVRLLRKKGKLHNSPTITQRMCIDICTS